MEGGGGGGVRGLLKELLKEKNFIERLDSIKKLINICMVLEGPICLRHGDENQIFSDSKVRIRFSILPTPKEAVNELNQLLFRAQNNGRSTDNVRPK